MKIKRNGMLYKIAYGHMKICQRPNEFGICALTWRILFMTLIGWPCLGAFWGLVGAMAVFIVIVCAVSLYSLGFFFAMDLSDEPNRIFEPYEKWPQIKGFRIYPIYFVIACWLIMDFHAITKEVANFTIYSNVFRIIVGIIVFVAMAVKIKGLMEKSAPCQTLKQKFCPTVKVV